MLQLEWQDIAKQREWRQGWDFRFGTRSLWCKLK
jgi:hypothetical protein